ncbi:unnamed protein product [Hyaloperonospora brassicae]|uniref:Nucleoporin Nup133/Nup155-like N-terminal domain-containing protein n=1 Tax=Hyaloperonospora brassicae TaxID=162125 RepID=A0AAV0UUG9_HYABA|nr:unnamed protein product [Hyaloperonospora brassicae]
MRPLLQEARFACFDDRDDSDGASSSTSSLPTFAIPSPTGRLQPRPSSISGRPVACRGSGSFVYQSERFRDRFVCWRVAENVLVLREWSFHTTLKRNGIRLEFPDAVVATGVLAVESGDDARAGGGNAAAVTISVVTLAGTIYRFTYSMPNSIELSIFSEADVTATPEPKPATCSRCDMLQSLTCNEVLTAVFWVDEYNAVVGTNAGRVMGVNLGLSVEPRKVREFVFSDQSVASWLWHGLVQSTAGKLTGSCDESRTRMKNGAAVLAVTCFQIDEDDDGIDKDVCVVTISADCVLRAWSFSSQSCTGRQQLRALVTTPPDDCDVEVEEQDWNDGDVHSNDDDGCDIGTGVYATYAKVMALSPTESDNCRLLVHLDFLAAHSPEIFLLRGDVQLASMSSAGASGGELVLSIARVFTVQAPEQRIKRGLKMVDFAVDKDLLFSSWRSHEGDEVYTHANPMALTGPKRIFGQLVSTIEVQMQKYEAEDSEWLFDANEEDAMAQIDDFFAERVLLPGRFSRQNLSSAIVEAQNDALGSSDSPSLFDHSLPKYKDALIRLVTHRCADAAGAAVIRNGSTSNLLRIMIWKELIALCTKHWRCANVPIGFATTMNMLLSGAPVMLRRNCISLLFPSAPLVAAAFAGQVKQGSTSGECVAALVSDVLPIFDAIPSQIFQSFVHSEVAGVAYNQKVESFVALARHCVRLGLNPDMTACAAIAGQSVSADLLLTRAILRFGKILGGDDAIHDEVLCDLVEHFSPLESGRGPRAHIPSPSKREYKLVIGDEGHKRKATMANADILSIDHCTTRQLFFAGHEICYAFGQVASGAIDEICAQSLRVVLFLAYLVDTRPAFLGPATLNKIVQLYLPRSISVYQRWRLSQWVVSQGFALSGADADLAAASTATLTQSLLQMFLLDINGRLNGSNDFKRALSVLQLASASNSVRSEEVHTVLTTFTRDILQHVSYPNDSLMRFLQKRQQYRILRAIFCCNLSDFSLHDSWKKSFSQPPQGNKVHKHMRSIGECLAFESREAAACSGDDVNARDYARSCFQQAIRCFSICLTNFLLNRNDRFSLSEKGLEQFIYEVVGLLKETVPRGSYDQLLSFLWTVISQAFSHLAQYDGSEPSFAVQTFIWVNVFKYSVEERLFHDAHLALMHTAELATSLSGSASTGEAESTASECVNYLVKELYRYGQFDLICDLHWGSLQPQVENHILWQAGNATVVQGDGSHGSAIRYYNLLYTFYMRKQQPASAASAMYTLAQRLRLTISASASKAVLEAQRNALNAACNALQVLPSENRWIVQNTHAEELKRLSLDAPEHVRAMPYTSVVTLEDVKRDLSVLDGKLRLLSYDCSEGTLLGTMDRDEVIALLVDAVHRSCHSTGSSTEAERGRAGIHSIEIAADIAARSPVATMSGLTKSLARYCASSEHPTLPLSSSRSDSDLLWELLESLLANVGSLDQYEVAAETVLDFWPQAGRKLVLPEWLKERLASSTSGNPVKLLALYLKHGLLLEGLELVEGLLLDVAAVGREEQPLTSSALSPDCAWIPYNLVDMLLDSTAAVLNQNVSEGASHTDVARLREHDYRLRQQLSRYFCSANALQQAQEAASLARSCIGIDS